MIFSRFFCTYASFVLATRNMLELDLRQSAGCSDPGALTLKGRIQRRIRPQFGNNDCRSSIGFVHPITRRAVTMIGVTL